MTMPSTRLSGRGCLLPFNIIYIMRTLSGLLHVGCEVSINLSMREFVGDFTMRTNPSNQPLSKHTDD